MLFFALILITFIVPAFLQQMGILTINSYLMVRMNKLCEHQKPNTNVQERVNQKDLKYKYL